MDVGVKLWVFLLGGIAIVGAAWCVWSRLIGFPTHDPTSSRPPDGDPSAIDMRPPDRGNHTS